MARLTVYKDNRVDSTVVSNLFIDEYMTDANDAQLKVYLYLLRMMNAHQATSVSDIADKFNHTEKDIVRALKYWEKHHLIDLDFDQNKCLVGIHMRDPEDPSEFEAEQNSSSTASFVPQPAVPSSAKADHGPAAVRQETEGLRVPDIVWPSSELQTVAVPAKPSYTADQLREFKNRQNTAQLLFIAEAYVGKPLTPAELKTILFFTDELHFSDDLIDYLLQYCVERGKRDFKYIEKVAISWAEQGITTPEQASESGGRYSKDAYDIVKALGSSNMPTEAEMSYITRWTVEYAFPKEIILEACKRTVLAVNSNRFKYADALLRSWHEHNVRKKSDILKIDEAYRQQKKEQAAPTPKQCANRFNQFTQNTYDFETLEKELLSN